MRQIFLDTETTGLEIANGNRIVEIGCVEMIDRALTGRNFHQYINPERDSEAGALEVHGLSSDFLSTQPTFAEIASDFLQFVQDAEVIIHNAPFDTRFIDHELKIMQHPNDFASHVATVTDSLVLARKHYPGRSNNLDALCKRLEVSNEHRTLHGALLDAELLAEVYIRLTRGQKNLLPEQDSEAQYSHIQTRVDFQSLVLPVAHASSEECAAHAHMLETIDKASGGKTLWRTTPKDTQAWPPPSNTS